jgi:hypothetical protein
VHPRRRQLEGERDPIQPTADLGNRPGILRVQRELRYRGSGAVHEQANRRGGGDLVQGQAIVRGWCRERPDRQPTLGPQAQRRAAGRQHRQPRAARQQLGQPRGYARQMLQIVQHQQRPPLAQVPQQQLTRARPARLLQPQGPGDRRRHEPVVVQWGQVDEGRPVGVVGSRLAGDGQRQASLAYPARPGQRQQARRWDLPAQQRQRRLHLRFAADQRGRGLGQRPSRDRLVRRPPGRSERRLQQGFPLAGREAQGVGQAAEGLGVRTPPNPLLERADRRRAEPGPLGERLLAQAGPQPIAAQQRPDGAGRAALAPAVNGGCVAVTRARVCHAQPSSPPRSETGTDRAREPRSRPSEACALYRRPIGASRRAHRHGPTGTITNPARIPQEISADPSGYRPNLGVAWT